MGFSRQKCWSGLPCPLPGDLPNPGIKLVVSLCLLHWQLGSLPLAPPGKLTWEAFFPLKSLSSIFKTSFVTIRTEGLTSVYIQRTYCSCVYLSSVKSTHSGWSEKPLSSLDISGKEEEKGRKKNVSLIFTKTSGWDKNAVSPQRMGDTSFWLSFCQLIW